MRQAPTADIAASAARLMVEEGLEYAAAKHQAARQWGGSRRRPEWPANEQVEDEVRDYLALFHADTQPADLATLRRLALQWMQRLAAFRPYLAGAAWRGTATRQSSLCLDLYCDDPKAAEIALIDMGLAFDAQALDGPGSASTNSLLTLAVRCADWREPVTLHLSIYDHDDLRGALKPDARGRTWRGDATALQARLQAEV